MAILRFLSQAFSEWRVCRKIEETDELLDDLYNQISFRLKDIVTGEK